MYQKRRKTNKIQMLHLVQNLSIGGAEILIFHYIKALGNENYEHYVYCFGADGPVRQKIESLGVPIRMGKRVASIKCPIRFVVSLQILIRDLLDFISSNRIQIIQSHLGHPNQLGVAIGKLSGVHVFPTIHNTMDLVDLRNRWDFRVYIVKLVNVIIYRLAGQIIAVSEEVKKIVRQRYHLRDSKILVLNNGIIFEDCVHRSVDLAKEFPDSLNKLKLIAVGRLTYQKAFEVLVRAIAEVTKRGQKDLFVMIAGDGEDRLKLETLIHNFRLETYIKLLGIRHDIVGLMKASDLFVMPSRFEGLSIAMIEAMACGLPVIASNAAGLRDHVKEGQNGLLFPIEDYKALAEHILLLVRDHKLRIQLAQGARESFKKGYNMRKNIKLLDTVFRKYTTIR